MQWRQSFVLASYVSAALAAAWLLHWYTKFFDHSADLLVRAHSPYGRDPSPEQLDQIARAFARNKLVDPNEFGSCQSTLQTLQDAEGFCTRVEELNVCTERLRETRAERCSNGEELERAGQAAVQRIGEALRQGVAAVENHGAGSELHCVAGAGGHACANTSAVEAGCKLKFVGGSKKTAFSICGNLVPEHGCVFYTYGISQDHASDLGMAGSFKCSGLAFDPAAVQQFAMHEKVAFFKVGAPMPHLGNCTDCAEAKFETAGPAVVQQLSGHERISVLKMNCGGCEYQLALDVLARDPSFFNRVDQVLVEVHADGRATSKKHASNLGLLLAMFQQAGLTFVHARLSSCTRQREQGQRPCSPWLKDSGFFCNDEHQCMGLLFARLPSGAVPDKSAIKQAHKTSSMKHHPDSPSATSADASEREKFYQQACEDGRQGGYAQLPVVWSPEEQDGLCGSCMLLGNYYSSNPDWQKVSGYGSKESEGVTGKYTDCSKTKSCTPVGVSIDVMRMYYDSVLRSGCCCTLLHDGAFSEDFQAKYRTERVRFLQVDALKLNVQFNRKFGLNDARFFNMHEAFCAHKGWQKLFFSDIFDVKIGSSPCSSAKEGTLYIGTDNAAFASKWLERRFTELGQAYLEFFRQNLMQEAVRPMWSAGIVGAGDRETMADFLAKLLAVLTDPEIAAVKRGDYQGVNMAAVNYVAERFFSGRAKGGHPLNSKYRAYERHRRDVWFVHK
mmetsp:Transcript_159109/g.296456  ORF Transcript_159109/g.296456 Transcript_159109/m.296456 type:complete len:729 (-) Transcript_159109:69-2255(-)